METQFNLENLVMEEVIENSFLDFHCKGLSYICLKRSELQTVKLYFFEGDVSNLPEVVAPHDHRYHFSTSCISGAVENRWYSRRVDRSRRRASEALIFQEFAYMTPLLGGNGFTWTGETKLWNYFSHVLDARETDPDRPPGYYMHSHEIHTIKIRTPGTILKIHQHEDRVPVDQPTATFTLDREPPSLSGLYRKPTADDVIRLLAMVK